MYFCQDGLVWLAQSKLALSPCCATSPSDLNKFRDLVENSLPKFPYAASACCEPTCDVDQSSLDEFCIQLSACLLDSASASIPMYHNSGRTRIAGWNDSARPPRVRLTFGIKCGLKLAVLLQVSWLKSRKLQNQGMSMLCAD